MNYPEGISICITVYHSQKYIKETLDSVFAQTYFQNHDNWEVLLGLDGDIEDWNYIKTFINDYKYNSHIRVLLMDSNKGTYITSNTIMSEAIYNHMLRFDSDDIMPPDFIERVVSVMNTCDIVRVMCENFGNKPAPAHPCYGIICLSKEIFLKYGGYKAWPCSSDAELIHRLKDRVNILQTDITFLRRIHEDNLTQSSIYGMKTNIRKKCLEYNRTKSPTHPFVKTRTNSFKNMIPLKVALCAIAKNENLYIKEWVEWYKNLGISKIFLYDNNEFDGERFEDVINDYIQSGFVLIIDVRGLEKGLVYNHDGINLLTLCYFDCYEKHGKEFNWICFFDVDEFLTFKKNLSLHEFLNQEIFNKADTILIRWELYDDGNLICYKKGNVRDRFTHVLKKVKKVGNKIVTTYAVKSIVRTNRNIYDKTMINNIHCFRLEGNTVYDNGQLVDLTTVRDNFPRVPDDVAENSICVLNHYKTKSLEEYLQRHIGRHWGTSRKLTSQIQNLDSCMHKFYDVLLCKRTLAKDKFRLMYKYSEFDLFHTINYRYYYNLYNDLDFEEFKQQINKKYNRLFKRDINFDNPTTLNDKLNWLNVYDINPLKCYCADKILVHEYSKKILGKDICVPILKIYASPDDINVEELPDKFVLKCNHGYKMNIICTDKNKFNQEEAEENCKKWLSQDFGKEYKQYHYCGIKPKCYVEKYLTNGDTGLTDYKIWCCNGAPQFILVINDRYGERYANAYDLNWNLIHLDYITMPERIDKPDKKPETLDLMIEYSKQLSSNFKFVRIDFYEVNGECYLGEMTFTPANGKTKFLNLELVLYYSDQLDLTD